MAKTEDEKLIERLKEIENLMKQRAEIDARLKEITGIRVKKDDEQPKPEGFVLVDAMRKVLSEDFKEMSAQEIAHKIHLKYSYLPDIKNIRSTAEYMTKRKILEKTPNKTYKIIPIF